MKVLCLLQHCTLHSTMAINLMSSALQPSQTGMTTVRPRTYVVYVRPSYASRFWATDDGRIEFSAASLQEFAEELQRRGAARLYGLPQGGVPGRQDLSANEVHELRVALHLPEVVVDPDIMGGTPCMSGSRLPATTLVACADKNDWQRVVDSWPWLTLAHVDAARAWLAEHS